MQIHRLFEMVYILIDKKQVTAKELAEHFEISIRTVYRDVELLSGAGLPIYTSQGSRGGIFIHDDYILNKLLLNDEEQRQILSALASLPIQIEEGDNLKERLMTFFHKEDENWIEVDFSQWGMGEQKYLFDVFRQAISKSHELSFEYFNSKGEIARRHVEPIKLVFKHKSWYLYAFCLERKDYRIFKVSRMNQVEDTNKHFTFNHDKSSKQSIDTLAPMDFNVKLKFCKEIAYRVYDEFYRECIERLSDDSLIVTTCLTDDDYSLDYLLSYGSYVEIIEPFEFKQKMKEKIQEIALKYQ